MAYRNTNRRKFNPAQVLPAWTSTQTDTVTMAFKALLSKLGITDTASYFRQLRILIVISVVVCACIGATNYGITGFILGGLAGLLAPAALIWLAVMLVGAAIFLGLYVLAWTGLLYVLRWLLTEFFRF
jgi:hypothetical protein